mgnify:CR=1 FL=1
MQIEPVSEPVVPSARSNVPTQMGPHASGGALTPLSPGRFAVRFTMGEAEHELLTHAKALLGHAMPSGDVGRIPVHGSASWSTGSGNASSQPLPGRAHSEARREGVAFPLKSGVPSGIVMAGSARA